MWQPTFHLPFCSNAWQIAFDLVILFTYGTRIFLSLTENESIYQTCQNNRLVLAHKELLFIHSFSAENSLEERVQNRQQNGKLTTTSTTNHALIAIEKVPHLPPQIKLNSPQIKCYSFTIQLYIWIKRRVFGFYLGVFQIVCIWPNYNISPTFGPFPFISYILGWGRVTSL